MIWMHCNLPNHSSLGGHLLCELFAARKFAVNNFVQTPLYPSAFISLGVDSRGNCWVKRCVFFYLNSFCQWLSIKAKIIPISYSNV